MLITVSVHGGVHQFFMGEPVRDPGKFDTIVVALLAERIKMERLVGQADRVGNAIQMPNGGVKVHGFDRIAERRMNDVEELTELQQLLEIFPVAGPATAVTIDDIGCAGNA